MSGQKQIETSADYFVGEWKLPPSNGFRRPCLGSAAPFDEGSSDCRRSSAPAWLAQRAVNRYLPCSKAQKGKRRDEVVDKPLGSFNPS